MSTTPASETVENEIAAIAWTIAQGLFPGSDGPALELRRRIHRTIDLCDAVAHRHVSIRDEVARFIADLGARNEALRDRAGTIDEILQIEEEAYRRSLPGPLSPEELTQLKSLAIRYFRDKMAPTVRIQIQEKPPLHLYVTRDPVYMAETILVDNPPRAGA